MSNISELRRQAALFMVVARRADDADAVRIFRNLAASVLAWAEDIALQASAAEEAAPDLPAEPPEGDQVGSDRDDFIARVEPPALRARRSA